MSRVDEVEINYPQLCGILKWMLKFDQKERPDFLDLAKYFGLTNKPAVCVHCGRISESFQEFNGKSICTPCIEASINSFWVQDAQ